ncbi:MAG: pilus assembly protein [Chloroflexi bacterium]|nr:pilus assembly protein [Chloroflexota bacterium]
MTTSFSHSLTDGQAADKGQSVVELALLLPVLLLILLGALDLGRAFATYVAITNGSREGARYGASNPTDTTGIGNYVAQEISGATASIACYKFGDNSPVACASVSTGDRIQVTVTMPFNFLTLYLFRLPSISMSNFTTMAIINGN